MGRTIQVWQQKSILQMCERSDRVIEKQGLSHLTVGYSVFIRSVHNKTKIRPWSHRPGEPSVYAVMQSCCMISLNPMTHYEVSPTDCEGAGLANQLCKLSPTDTQYFYLVTVFMKLISVAFYRSRTTPRTYCEKTAMCICGLECSHWNKRGHWLEAHSDFSASTGVVLWNLAKHL